MSDDGEHGLTIIAFIGSVFSPYYASARRRAANAGANGAADPLNHCALNVALYQPGGGGRWAMTERGRAQVRRAATQLRIGPSGLRWEGNTLVIEIDEVAVPWLTRLRGEVRVRAHHFAERSYPLDAAGLHRWRPIAPFARVEVAMDRPGMTWRGTGYLDSNHGDAPLEAHFSRWDWSRAALPGRRAAVLYDVTRRDGTPFSLALEFDEQARAHPFAPPPRAALPATGWRVARHTRCDAGRIAKVDRTLEDAPFYARTLLSTHVCGQAATAVHESLSLERFDTRWVQSLLPFRMPRLRG